MFSYERPSIGSAIFLNLILAFMALSASACDVTTDPDIKYFDIRLTETIVPSDLTTYVCQVQQIPVPTYEIYHAVAFEPLINNKDVMHHMLLFGVDDSHHSPAQSLQLSKPHPCGDIDGPQRTFLAQWSMGLEGLICSPPQAGVRFGRTSFTSLALQIHWNNARFRDNMTDSSGFRVYYTTKLREFDLGNVQVGQNDLEIPPGQGRYPQTGSCSSECTSTWLQHPIYLTRAHIHMHYIGDGGSLNLLRDGQIIQEIVTANTYDYNYPPAHVLSEPVRVLPGDELRLTCLYNSRDGAKMRNHTVYWGEGSDGEMCYAFISYYPRIEQFDQCIQFDSYDICSADGMAPFGECIFEGFLHMVESGMARLILTACQDKDGSSNNTLLCSESCTDAIREIKDNPCMQGRLEQYLRRVYLPDISSWAQVSWVMEQNEQFCH